MRLIDADKVKNYILTEGFYCGTQADKEYTAELFTKLFKTEKAIPIETIKKEIERLKEDIKWAWYYGNTALDKMEYLELWLEIKLENWEKENEIDRP